MSFRGIIVLAALLLISGCGLYSAEHTLDVEWEVPETLERLHIHLGRGPVAVVGSVDDRITGTAVILAKGYRTEEEAEERAESVRLVADLDGETGTLHVDMPAEAGFDSVVVSLELHIPRRLIVDISGADDQVSVVNTGVGLVSGVNARVDLVGTHGDGEIATSNAPVALRNHEGDLTVGTTNGSIRMRDVRGSLLAQTTHAPIDVTVFPESDGEILLQTVGHDVTLGIPMSFGADFVGEARVGRVSIGSLAIRRTLDEPDRVQGVIGDGEGRIRIFTRNGNIAVNGVDFNDDLEADGED